MKRIFSLLVLGSVLASPALAAGVEKGQMLFDNGGARLGVIYKVTADGSAQIILDGRLITVPASTLSDAAGRVQTSLGKNQLT